MIDSVSSKQAYTFSNASGFFVSNNGSFPYDGPLNQLGGSPCCSSASLTVNGETFTISSATFESDTGIRPRLEGGNTHSNQLTSAILPPAGSSVGQMALEYRAVVGGPTRIGATNSYTLQEKVDGQSLSIFSQMQPSVFP
ncbi:MAG: hypothetical protein ACKOCM_00850 [Cyanobacteriota bacterium]